MDEGINRMSNKLIYEANIDAEEIRTEDSGQAKIANLFDDSDTDSGVFFRFQSWCEGGTEHTLFDSLMQAGKRVRITMEVLD
jgi:hypothetical protein